jgi:multiple sugar transport system substrate-binding protein
MEWANLGGYTCHIETLESQEFLDATPYNPTFKKSMEIFRDFWAEPQYGELLESFSKNVGAYIIRDEGTAKQALDKCTEEWEAVFRKAGYLD